MQNYDIESIHNENLWNYDSQGNLISVGLVSQLPVLSDDIGMYVNFNELKLYVLEHIK